VKINNHDERKMIDKYFFQFWIKMEKFEAKNDKIFKNHNSD
jgi:hypothetical protein